MSSTLKGRRTSSSNFSTRATTTDQRKYSTFNPEIALDGMAKLYASPGITKLYGVIGRGRFGTVYHCRDEKRGGVAVKTFDMGVFFRPECIELQELRHPNLVRMYRTLNEPTVCGMVLELCGRSLHDLLHTEYGRGIEVVADPLHRLRAALDVACALKYLHRKELCHCDVTSGHVFLSSSLRPGATEIMPVKLGDFMTLRKKDSDSMKLCTGSSIYMPPEEMHVSPTHVRSSFASDTYAFGILLHEIISRTLPYHGHGLREDPRLGLLVKTGLRPNVTDVPMDCHVSSKWGASIRRKIVACMEKCWLHEASSRPSAADVVKETKDILKDWASIRFLLALGRSSSPESRSAVSA